MIKNYLGILILREQLELFQKSKRIIDRKIGWLPLLKVSVGLVLLIFLNYKDKESNLLILGLLKNKNILKRLKAGLII